MKYAVDPKIFGPPLWITLFTIAHYLDEHSDYINRNEGLKILYSISYIIPCGSCRDHTRDFFLRNMHVFQNNTFVYILYKLKDDVNKRLHKRSPRFENIFIHHWDSDEFLIAMGKSIQYMVQNPMVKEKALNYFYHFIDCIYTTTLKTPPWIQCLIELKRDFKNI